MGGRRSTTNVNQTGLGDSQFGTLRSGQDAIRGDLRTIETGARDEIRRLDQPIRGIDDRVRDLSGDVRFGLADVNRNIAGQTQELGSQFADVNRGITGLENNVGNIGRDVTAGFGEMSNQFGQVGSQLTGLSNAVDTGFTQAGDMVRSGFADTNANLNMGFDQASQERMAGFTGLGDLVGSGFAGQADFLNNMSANVLGGQQSLQDLLNQTGGRMDAFYGDLASGQQGIANQIGGVDAGLSDFTTQYGRDTTMANRQRADIQQAQQSGTDRISNDLAGMQGANSVAQQRLMEAVSGVGQDVMAGTNQTLSGFDRAAQQQQSGQNEFAQRINTIRSLIETTGQNLDANTRQQYMDLSNSFDQAGNLLANSVDQQGFRISRAMDNTGNLILNRFDQAGNRVAGNVLNVPTMFQQAEAYQRMMQQQQVPTGGLASPLPFAQT